MAKWMIIEPSKDEMFVLKKGRKQMAVAQGQRALETYFEHNSAEGDTLEHQAPDGYRTTLRGRRRGWRSD